MAGTETILTNPAKDEKTETTGPAFAIGDRIRILRINQKRTLQEVADGADLSKSMISKIENNKTVPSVAALVKIAQTLGTNVSNLMEDGGFTKARVTSFIEAEQQLTLTEKGYSFFPYASEFHQKKMQPFLFVAKKGEVVPHQLSHDGEEFVYILQGELKMQVGETEYLLKTGDSLYFNALQKHGITPVADTTTYLDIFV